jgi:hypothetical protein
MWPFVIGYALKRLSLKSKITVLSSYVKIELISMKASDAQQPIEFP